eukprot:COSAG05_NODE_92_length_19835_cov_158.918271_5_plen_163_part_00
MVRHIAAQTAVQLRQLDCRALDVEISLRKWTQSGRFSPKGEGRGGGGTFGISPDLFCCPQQHRPAAAFPRAFSSSGVCPPSSPPCRSPVPPLRPEKPVQPAVRLRLLSWAGGRLAAGQTAAANHFTSKVTLSSQLCPLSVGSSTGNRYYYSMLGTGTSTRSS